MNRHLSHSAAFLALAVVLQGCMSVASYSAKSQNPATIEFEDHTIWDSDKTNHFARVFLESIDGLVVGAPGVTLANTQPVKVDAGTHRIQLQVSEIGSDFHGSFILSVESGRKYVFRAVRNPKIKTHAGEVIFALFGTSRTNGFLEERKAGDPQDYGYTIKLIDTTESPDRESASFEVIIVDKYELENHR